MKTEFLTELGLTEDQIKSIMAENGKDIKREQDKAVKLESERDNYKEQLETAQTALKDFDGVDVKDLQLKITKLNEDLKAKDTEYQGKIADIEFNKLLDSAIAETGAKSAKAVRAFLDIDVLKTSKNQSEDIKKSLESIKTENDYLFESNEPIKKPVRATGSDPVLKPITEMSYDEYKAYRQGK
ncbi:phage scaffolding protein [Anaerocolumna chitinilytica]|uniref:Scaffold protein n=1 Tax=Anaerocolumna chitinilytica TaxID=1727145 RepID=A0A7M3SAI7_9FIRM|nr:phage scaffolding protein [Anaerocolumna chitinilytica]BCK01605.1 scaffold protein [Anaerocolumna chitinilytica]